MSQPQDSNNPTSVFDSTRNQGGRNPGDPSGQPSLVGEVLKGAFRIDAKLGEGGMGTVYRGTQLSLGRAVAIKTILANKEFSDQALQRLFREAKVLSQLNHPNIVTIIDFGTAPPNDTPFLVMELLSGEPLDAYILSGHRPPLRQLLGLMGQICAGLSAAHRANIIHRDLKPSNVFVVTDGGEPMVKLLDFGLARPAAAVPESGLAVTQAGVGVGTCGFTAPEQLEGTGEPDARADVYGLGAILYFLLTGRAPYVGKTFHSVIVKQMAQKPDPIDFPQLGLAGAESIEPILHKAMSVALADRYQSVGEFKGAMEAILTSILSGAEFRSSQEKTGTTHAGTREPTQLVAPGRITGTASGAGGGSRRWLLPVGGVLGLGVIALVVWLVISALRGTDGSSTNPTKDAVAAKDSGPGNDSGKPGLTATAPGVSATEITLGLSAPFSGPAKELGRDMQVGIETCLHHVNETNGGIHGRKLKLLALDDGYDPKRCAETMTEMIQKRPVFAFIGNVGTPTAEVSVPMVLEHKRVLFGAFTGADLLRRDPPDRYIFNYRASYADETAAIVHYLQTIRHVKPDQIAVFAQQDGYGDAGFNGVAKALRKVGYDTEKILRVGYPRNTMEIEPAVAEILKHRERIKAVVMVPTYRQAAAFIKRLRDEGMNPIFTSVSFVGSEAFADALKETAPKYAEGVIVTQVVPFPGSSATGVLQYREHLAKYFPTERPGFVSLEGYIAGRVFCTALEKTGPELTTERLVAALETLQNLDLSVGIPISFGPSNHQGSHKVWAAVLDAGANFHQLDLD
jgi:serine/threonine protein kinase/ABC-type branched-subunit amino acid transport system substrate-binding protein